MQHKVSELVRKKILTDNEFSMELAVRLGIQQQSVKALARRNSKLLTLHVAINFYKEQGIEENSIFLNSFNT